ncbi:DNA-binding transcriptional activator of the SARP family [Glycomyces sambucus]|uniref:DNA-binding transcriptional activator of the SARP family n=1 Tax=Glycomyces sambucus TaxID=380244 RepID=A0A1G9G4T8_9ACTN|nr:BTAD domain-containing putative transcriptional regulator [Glycomyces sambucus]SDK95621.1 DNA-binding transcriptional activator of the SARP family [Glycomyces sambucus]
MSGLRVHMLGPFSIGVDGVDLALTTGRLRSMLAVLALTPGRRVSWEQLGTAMWGESPPDHPRRSLQTYAGRLRAVVGADGLQNHRAGLTLAVAPEDVDTELFDRLLSTAANAPVEAEYGLLKEALSLWRGDPFEGVESQWLADTQAPRLWERYVAAVERRTDLDLESERYGDAAVELRELADRFPLRESVWARLLVVLDRTGRSAEALQVCDSVRRRLADELGTDPGADLKRLHAELLAGRRLRWGGAPRPRAGANAVPRQLPVDTLGFVGRTTELRELETSRSVGGRSMFVVWGMAGTGKTALAVHWARRLAGRFPDGQLYADLSGFSASGRPAAPADVLHDLMLSLGVSPESIPDAVAARVGAYRTLMAERRVLVLLDNARDAEQVRPLLPGGDGCLTIVTSRDRMAGLVSGFGAQPVGLSPLTPPESRALLAARLGTDRVGAEPEAAAEIAALCAGLPLALSVVAARASLHPGRPLTDLLADLHDRRDRLNALGGDTGADVRAALSWSYRLLGREAGRMFRLLSIHPGREVSATAAASLVGQPLDRARPALAELVRACLLTEAPTGRYSFHDLLRAYAMELTERQDAPARRAAALDRLTGHYLHSAHHAALQLDPQRAPVALDPPHRAVAVARPQGADEAVRWFSDEYGTLTALVADGAEAGRYDATWVLAWALAGYQQRRVGSRDWLPVHGHALACARAAGDLRRQAMSLRVLGQAHTRLGNEAEAEEHFAEAYRASCEAGDLAGQASTLENLGALADGSGRYADAIEYNERALDLNRRIARRSGEADSLNNLGWLNARLGFTDKARDHCERAIALYRGLGNRRGEAFAWDSLGSAEFHAGRYEEAARSYQRALEHHLSRTGAVHDAAGTFDRLGDAFTALGDESKARRYYRLALEILEAIEHRGADAVRGKLNGHADGMPGPGPA